MASGPAAEQFRPPSSAPLSSSAPPLFVFEPSDDDTHREISIEEDGHHGRPSIEPLHPHAAALLRRSPSPTQHARSYSEIPSTSLSPASALRHPNTGISSNSFGSGSSSYLHPSDAMGDLTGGYAGSGTTVSANAPFNGAIPDAAAGAKPIPVPSPTPASGPFNFQTQYISTSPVKSIGQRRGHRYKHSSVSTQHQIFQEPPQRPPPVLPASLPVPTLREAWASLQMQRGQRMRLWWCLCHAAVAVYVFLGGSSSRSHDSLALTALSHLVFFDVGSAAVCVAVDVLGNFEVWRRSTIRHPFGLRRAEVLAGFAMSIFLVFGGFDLLSHDLKDWLEDGGGGESSGGGGGGGSSSSGGPVHYHSQTYGHYGPPSSLDGAALAAFAGTLISAFGLGNHARIRRALLLRAYRIPFLSSKSLVLPAVLANPFHLLTLVVSLVLLLLPLLLVAVPPWLDRLLCATIALSMFVLGARLAVAQGLMLLMSYGGGDGIHDIWPHASSPSFAVPASASPSASAPSPLAAVLAEIAAVPQIARVDDAQFWQVHYGLCMANLRLRIVRGCDDSALRQLRARVARVIQNRLGEGYGRGNSLRWEVTVQTSVEG